jgi:hypothetical protein
MQPRPHPPPPRRDAVGEHVHDGVEVGPRELGIRCRPPAEREEPVLVLILARADRHQLLGEHVQRRAPEREPVDLGAAGRADQRRALHQLVAREGKQPPLRRGGQRVAGAAHALQRGGNGARRAEQAGEIDRAHVDAELQRGGGHYQAQLAGFQPLLGVEAARPAQARVMRGDALRAQALGEVPGHPLDETPRVDEHQGGAVRAGHLGHAVVDLLPLLVRAHRAQLVAQDLDSEIHVAALAPRPRSRASAGWPDEQPRRRLDRAHRGGQAHALKPRHAAARRRDQLVQPLERQREMSAALVARHRVDLVHDDGADLGQPFPAGLGGEENEQRLGRRDEDVRRPLPAWRRSCAGVSPVRTAVRISGAGKPAATAAAAS